MATNYLTPLYGWNEKAGRYYNLKTGSFVPFMDVRNALESNISASQLEMRSLTQQLIDGTISRGDWYVGMERQIRLANVSASAAARGGWAQMTQSDWGAVGQQVRTQYDYLRNFANEIASGKQRLNGSALVRADLYGQAARGNFEEMRRRMAKLEGMTDEMRVLGEADHCDDCLSAAGHWAPIGTLPRIGDSQCVTNCRCTFRYRRPNADNINQMVANFQPEPQALGADVSQYAKLRAQRINELAQMKISDMQAQFERMSIPNRIPDEEHHFEKWAKRVGFTTFDEYQKSFEDFLTKPSLRYFTGVRDDDDARVWYIVDLDSGFASGYNETDGEHFTYMYHGTTGLQKFLNKASWLVEIDTNTFEAIT